MSLPISLASALAAPTTAIAVSILERKAPIEETAIFGLLYQIFLISCFLPGALAQFTISRLGNKSLDEHVILKQTVRYCIFFGVTAAIFIQLSPPIIERVLTGVQVQQIDSIFLGVAVCSYVISTAFLGYFNGVQNSWPIFIAQLFFVVPVLLCVIFYSENAGATSLVAGFALGSFFQLLVYLSIYFRRAITMK